MRQTPEYHQGADQLHVTTVEQTRQIIVLSRSRVQHRSHQHPLINSRECLPTHSKSISPLCNSGIHQTDVCVWWAWQPTHCGYTPTTSQTNFTSPFRQPSRSTSTWGGKDAGGGGSNCRPGDKTTQNEQTQLKQDRAARGKGEPTRLERRAAARAVAATAAAPSE